MAIVIGCILGAVGAHWFFHDDMSWDHVTFEVYGMLSLYSAQLIWRWVEWLRS